MVCSSAVVVNPVTAFAPTRCVAPVMGFGPSQKELSSDPAISEVLKVVKADQAERFARASLDGAAFATTLPGVLPPFGFWDPFEFTPKDQDEVLMFREAELQHGRVCMMVRHAHA